MSVKRIFIIFFVVVSLFAFYKSQFVTLGQDCGADLNCQIDQIQREIDAISPAHEQNKTELSGLRSQIASLNNRIDGISNLLKKNEADIIQREEDLGFAQILFEEKTKNHYRFIRLYDPLMPFLASSDATDAFREVNFRSRATDEDRKQMEAYADDLIALKNDKETLEKNQTSLASLKSQIAGKAEFLSGEVDKVESYLADLSSKQQDLLAAKFASAPVPLLAYTSLGGCSSDIGKDPGFSPRYGFFSFGVPNKTGMNQYGARGRAEAGQNYEQILASYYANVQIVDYGTGFNITANGTNEYGQTFNNVTMNIEEYLKHLYEMPTNWHPEALKAQVVAARSYALARTNNGQNSIPPNQSGQVVKLELNSSEWINAVNATSGKVMVQGGNPISAWYSSTHGGVVLSSGQIGWSDTPWTKQTIDTPSGSAGSFSDLKSNAYDKSSPWFFCDWGYRSQYNSTAWLKGDEVADIVNAFILWDLDNGTISHLSQTDKPTSDTWDAGRVVQEISSRGGSSIGSISSIGVGWDSGGISRTITVNGRSFDAQKFKNLFNLRAPANIQIKPTCQPDSSLNCNKMYALYDVVRE